MCVSSFLCSTLQVTSFSFSTNDCSDLTLIMRIWSFWGYSRSCWNKLRTMQGWSGAIVVIVGGQRIKTEDNGQEMPVTSRSSQAARVTSTNSANFPHSRRRCCNQPLAVTYWDNSTNATRSSLVSDGYCNCSVLCPVSHSDHTQR